MRKNLGTAGGFLFFLFCVSASSARESVVYSFQGGTDGSRPEARLLDVNGTLYGTSLFGGVNDEGTVFAVGADTGEESVVYSFGSSNSQPQGDLIDEDGLLYGTTSGGGPYSGGTVFSLDPSTGVETIIHDFGNSGDGIAPASGLVEVKELLYGTTPFGGSLGCGGYGCGTVFSIDPASGREKVLHAFAGSDGQNPYDDLIAIIGTLYGTTVWGGDFGLGTVFAMDRRKGTMSVLHSFGGGQDGQQAIGSLLNVGGTIYGTTAGGGSGSCSEGCGTVFSINPKSGAEQVVYAFSGNGTDGTAPTARLMEWKGKLYGTTAAGGSYNSGTVFAFDMQTGTESVLHSFGKGADGIQPEAPLTREGKRLFGTTYTGGKYGEGALFSLKP